MVNLIDCTNEELMSFLIESDSVFKEWVFVTQKIIIDAFDISINYCLAKGQEKTTIHYCGLTMQDGELRQGVLYKTVKLDHTKYILGDNKGNYGRRIKVSSLDFVNFKNEKTL